MYWFHLARVIAALNTFLRLSYEAKYRNLPRNIRPIVQKLEKLYKNLVKVSGTVSFNTLCLKNKLLPKYTYIDIFEEI